MSDIPLKPCPFCGGRIKWVDILNAKLKCFNCGIIFTTFDGKNIKSKWNKRVSDE